MFCSYQKGLKESISLHEQHLPYRTPSVGIGLWLVNGMTIRCESIMNFSLHGITPGKNRYKKLIQNTIFHPCNIHFNYSQPSQGSNNTTIIVISYFHCRYFMLQYRSNVSWKSQLDPRNLIFAFWSSSHLKFETQESSFEFWEKRVSRLVKCGLGYSY